MSRVTGFEYYLKRKRTSQLSSVAVSTGYDKSRISIRIRDRIRDADFYSIIVAGQGRDGASLWRIILHVAMF